MKLMEYSPKTQELIDGICTLVIHKEHTLDKKESEKFILKTYDLFNLARPKNIVWCTDLSQEPFYESTKINTFKVYFKDYTPVFPAEFSIKAWLKSSAELAFADLDDSSIRASTSAYKACLALSKRLLNSRKSIVGSTVNSSDIIPFRDAYNFVFCYEYKLNPYNGLVANENDEIYLEYCKLLLCAFNAGLGAYTEHNGTLYLMPYSSIERLHIIRDEGTLSTAVYKENNDSIVWRISDKDLINYQLNDIINDIRNGNLLARDLMELINYKNEK